MFHRTSIELYFLQILKNSFKLKNIALLNIIYENTLLLCKNRSLLFFGYFLRKKTPKNLKSKIMENFAFGIKSNNFHPNNIPKHL